LTLVLSLVYYVNARTDVARAGTPAGEDPMSKKRGETMGQRLRRLRQEAGFTQAQLAAAAGVPIGTLRNWEQGLRTPRLDTAAKVALALAVSIDALAGIETPGSEGIKKDRRPGGDEP
jgi:DNA-binding XRE family transcriptional regulator